MSGFVSFAAATAADIISRPPDVCIVSIETGSPLRLLTADATVLGMSYSLRSRKTLKPIEATSFTKSRP